MNLKGKRVVVTGGGMYHHTLWLVYKYDVIILIYYIKRYILGKNIGHDAFRYLILNNVVAANLVTCFDRSGTRHICIVSDKNKTLFDHLLNI